MVKEWREAIEDRAFDLADDIGRANPDLFEVTAMGHRPRKENA